ncbi:MAG: hypothetical protein QOI66_1359 [Myxococcales bacterium]|jgi:hypothetical protein|nr:hypothetical protein [Myxococcales bacterium]
MMTACPSALQLARWEAGVVVTGQRHEWLIEHSRGCARCSALIAEIVAARRELFPQESRADVVAAAQTVISAAAQQRAQRSGRWRRFRLLAGLQLLTGLMAAAFIAPKLNPSTQADLSSKAGAAPVELTKGQLVLQAFCTRGDVIFPIDDSAACLRGARLRLAYSVPAAGHLMIFGVDERGQIFPYYGEGSLSSIPVGAEAEGLLPGSIGLDDQHGRERIFALWAAEPIDATRVKIAVTRAMVGGDVARVSTLNVGVDQTSVLLRRP